jgi:hypothetical protein
MPGWGKLIAGAVIGAAGAIYATNEELRKGLPGVARDLPVTVRRRFEAATAAAREASALRRAEIMRELESHGAGQAGRRLAPSESSAPGLPAATNGLPEGTTPPRVVRRAGVERTEPAAPVDE